MYSLDIYKGNKTTEDILKKPLKTKIATETKYFKMDKKVRAVTEGNLKINLIYKISNYIKNIGGFHERIAFTFISNTEHCPYHSFSKAQVSS